MEKSTDFPKLIRNLRISRGETQAEFGKRFGVSHAAVSDWESGASEAPYKVLYEVLGFFSSQENTAECDCAYPLPSMDVLGRYCHKCSRRLKPHKSSTKDLKPIEPLQRGTAILVSCVDDVYRPVPSTQSQDDLYKSVSELITGYNALLEVVKEKI